MDIKAVDPKVHESRTGVTNRLILENAIRISMLTSTVVRVPLISGLNADKESIEAIGKFAKLMPGVNAVHLLPYHTYGENKYELLGRQYTMIGTTPVPAETVDALKGLVEGMGLRCVIGG